MNSTAKPQFISMGCRLNIAESEHMRSLAPDDENLVVVNSCAVTNEAVRQTRQLIRKTRRANPQARIIVTGCAAQIHPDMFRDMPETDLVLGNIEKLDAANFLEQDTAQKARVSDIMAVRQTAPHLANAFAEHARAFVEVQNGCDHRCTFCIIPFGRGNSRSVPAGSVVDTIRTLVDRGYLEVVLTGVDVTSYGHDLPGTPNLGQLVERILKHVPGLQRLRLSSLDGVEVDDRLFDLITGDDRVMPHVHLSLQSGDDMILKRMKRRHSRSDAIKLVERMKAKRPEIAIGADLIAGFPTETEEMHRNNLSIIDACDVVHGHIFPFSPRDGTPAARMPQLDRALIKQRAAELREATSQRSASWRETLIGKSLRILVEKDGRHGHAENFAKVAMPSQFTPGMIMNVRPLATNGDTLRAEPWA
jgi:threonylcarbamoyladenosine tRNA methylthiotransferase MtaB